MNAPQKKLRPSRTKGWIRIPKNYRSKYTAHQLEINYRQFRNISILVMGIVLVYLVQYEIAPGIEKETPLFSYYSLIFYALGISSLIIRVILPLIHKNKSTEFKEFFYLAYTTLLLTACVYLTTLDLIVSRDYTAYTVGVLTLAFIIRTSLTKYMILLSCIFSLAVLNALLFLDMTNTFELLLPILVVSVASAFIGYYSEKSRRQMYLLRTELEKKNEELRSISFKDPLTDIYNRRYLMEFLFNQISHFKRNRNPFSIMMIDIDHFKKINDQLGHATGDQALIELALLLQNNSREGDILARFGGEEFMIVMPDTPLTSARICAERIRRSAENHSFTGIDWPVTLSIGISETWIDDDINSLIERADKNLYKAKNRGRNRCVF